MNKIVSKSFLTRGKIISKYCYRQPGFTYSTCKLFVKHSGNIQKLKETRD